MLIWRPRLQQRRTSKGLLQRLRGRRIQERPCGRRRAADKASQRCRRSGSAAANAPSEPAVSSTTLYQARPQVLDASGTSPGMIACSRENAAERSVPVPFNIPTKAIARRTGTAGVKARARAPIAPRRESATSVRLRPARSAFVVTPIVARADPTKPAATTMPMLNEERPARNK